MRFDIAGLGAVDLGGAPKAVQNRARCVTRVAEILNRITNLPESGHKSMTSGRATWVVRKKSNRRDVMNFHAASLKNFFKAAAVLWPAAVLAVTLMTGAPAYAAQGGDENEEEAPTQESENSGEGSNNSGGKGGGSKKNTDAAELKQNKSETPAEPADDNSSTADADDEPMVFITTTRSGGQSRAKMRRTQKELARLFAMSDAQIKVEFPHGGFDAALVQAATRARRAERAYRRANR
jgi:hypothetical protein